MAEKTEAESPELLAQLRRIADALENQSHGQTQPHVDADYVQSSPAFIYHAPTQDLRVAEGFKALDIDLLHGIDVAKSRLVENTRQFAEGHRANNILLWGQRGMGKSSLITAGVAHLQNQKGIGSALKLIQINSAEIIHLGPLLECLRPLTQFRFVLFCDDLKFEGQNAEASTLKTLLDGGLEPRPDHVVFYATSNHRHLVARDMAENEMEIKIHGHETRDERLSLSDRFGISIGFHSCDQPTYLAMVEGYARQLGNIQPNDTLHKEAIAWAAMRGHRSGRVAMQFITDYLAKK